MKVVRFDREVSRSDEGAGSGIRFGSLIGDGVGVRVEVVHVDPNGELSAGTGGTGPTAARRLVAVVAGSGWAEGGDGLRRRLAPGQAAVFAPGEAHAVGSREAMTAVWIEGVFDLWALEVTKEIVVREYDPEWPRFFEAIRGHLWPAVGSLVVRADHVGSTSVEGLAAKPIIDVDLVVADEVAIRPVIDALGTIGYRWRGTLGVPGREAFAPPATSELPPHHLYLVVEDNKAHQDHYLLRDLLRDDAGARRRYGELKRRNAEEAAGDMDRYVAAKAAFVAELLTRARDERGLPPEAYWDPEQEGREAAAVGHRRAGAGANGAVADGAGADGAVADGAGADGAVADGAVADRTTGRR